LDTKYQGPTLKVNACPKDESGQPLNKTII
jgi:hypothetical protein